MDLTAPEKHSGWVLAVQASYLQLTFNKKSFQR